MFLKHDAQNITKNILVAPTGIGHETSGLGASFEGLAPGGVAAGEAQGSRAAKRWNS